MMPPRKPHGSRQRRPPAAGRHHDHSYKQLFAHAEMVRDLLTGFVREDWVQALDLASLETVKGSYVTDDFRDREDDIIWRVRWADGWCYVYLLIEFQSTVDPFMAVRIACYVALLYQDLIAQKALTVAGTLPPVLPVVLYNGEARWTAPTELATLIEPAPGGLARYGPHWSYLLLDEGAIVRDDAYPAEVRNLVAALFQLEKARDEPTWLAVYARLVELLDSGALESLKRAFGRWIYRSFIRKKRPGIRLPDIDDFHEVHVMLQQRVEQWNAEIRERGRREGLQEGLQEGLERGLEQGLERGLERGLEQGLEQGHQEARRDVALALLQRTALDDAAIADLTGLSREAIQDLRNTSGAHRL